MFGSKLRLWMENHIVRPRKKSSKNKNGTTNNLAQSNNMPNTLKGNNISHQGDSSTISNSAARRSEVSPIQNHTTSRAGWQSPQDFDDTISPKSDNFLHYHTVKPSSSSSSTTSPKNISSCQPYTLENGSTSSGGGGGGGGGYSHHCISANNPSTSYTNYRYQNQHQPTMSVTIGNNINPTNTISSSSSSSSKPQPQQHSHYSKNVGSFHSPLANNKNYSTTSSASTSNDEMLIDHHHHRNNYQNKNVFKNCITTQNSATSSAQAEQQFPGKNSIHLSSKENTDNNLTNPVQSSSASSLISTNTTKYENISNSPLPFDNLFDNLNTKLIGERTLSNIPPKLPPRPPPTAYSRNHPIIPINKQCQSVSSTNSSTSTNTFNHQIDSNKVNNNNNNKELSTPLSPPPPIPPPQNNINNNNNNNNNNCHIKNSTGETNIKQKNFHQTNIDGGNIKKPVTSIQRYSSTTTTATVEPNNRNSLRPHRSSNIGNHLTAPTQTHQLAHMINSLSSPESAYSTGYSTDGTSPGATYTPEYYINMRTGTHYFPRGVSSVVIEQSRQKFGLNKIDEAIGGSGGSGGGGNITSGTEQEPIVDAVMINRNCIRSTQQQQQQQPNNNHRRTESLSCEMRRRMISFNGPINNGAVNNNNNNIFGIGILNNDQQLHSQNLQITKNVVGTNVGLSPDVQRRLSLQTYKAMDSPSPRQRCRIRTNPWFSNIDSTISSISNPINSENKQILDMETSSTSSGIKSSSDVGIEDFDLGKVAISSDSDSSSSATEIEVTKKLLSPQTISKRSQKDELLTPVVTNVISDEEDTTLNEMMGKFDESYHYEKETDILSDDSDPTEFVTDLDTGQDGGDECDSEDLLDIDFIDHGSIQEIIDKDLYENTGSCSYYNFKTTEKPVSRLRKSTGLNNLKKHDQPQIENNNRPNSRRKKRLTRTRKTNRDSRDTSASGGATNLLSPSRYGRSGGNGGGSNSGMIRGSRSLGGTPVSLRRNQSESKNSPLKINPLSNRSNSLTFTEIHSTTKRKFLAIAESEKALLKADLEADVKYRQLIHEAETILLSMKTDGRTQSPSPAPTLNIRETPIPSPRRICSIPSNKRVEMLRNCEADLRREIARVQKLNETNSSDCSQETVVLATSATTAENSVLMNKRIEILKLDKTSSAPNSPQSGRFSPRKTHITNFICQNASPKDLLRRKSSPEPSGGATTISATATASAGLIKTTTTTTTTKTEMVIATNKEQSPHLQLNGRQILSPPKSPTPMRRRFRSQSPRVSIEVSDSDSDTIYNNGNVQNGKSAKQSEINGNENVLAARRIPNRKQLTSMLPPKTAIIENGNSRHTEDIINRNIILEKNPLISFRMGMRIPNDFYCPQSEPLKRKIYSGSQTLEKLKKSLELDSEIPKKALLEKILQLRRGRQSKVQQEENQTNNEFDEQINNGNGQNGGDCSSGDKRLLILNTIKDLKRSLEDQSIELCGLNDDDDDEENRENGDIIDLEQLS